MGRRTYTDHETNKGRLIQRKYTKSPPTCLNPLYMMRISCLVNLVCRHRSSRATGLGCGNADVLFSCSSSSISVASSMIGLSGGVAIARWPPNRSPLLQSLLLLPPLLPQLLLQPLSLLLTARSLLFSLFSRSSHAINTRTGHPMVRPGAPVVPARHRPRQGRPERSAAAATAQLFRCSIQYCNGLWVT